MKNRALKYISVSWRQYLLYGGALAAAAMVLTFRLFKLVPYASSTEIAARESARTIDLLIQNPLFLPHKLTQLALYVAGFDGLLASRFISVVFAFVAVLFFYRVVRTWYTPRVAFMASGLFLSASWLLHHARLATPAVLYLMSIALIWAGFRIVGNTRTRFTMAVIILVLLSLLFVPGFIWIIVAGIVWQRKRVMAEIKSLHNAQLAALALVGVVVLGILAQAFVRDTSLLFVWLGLPETFMVKEAALRLALTPYHVFIRAPFDPVTWLGRLPYVNVAMGLLFGLGCYVLYKSITLDRIRALLGILIIGSVLAALGGEVSLVIILPLICLAIAAGIALLLQQWFTVFPRNPIARGIGVAFVIALVSMSIYYNLFQYFEAWPKNLDTQAVFTERIE